MVDDKEAEKSGEWTEGTGRKVTLVWLRVFIGPKGDDPLSVSDSGRRVL